MTDSPAYIVTDNSGSMTGRGWRISGMGGFEVVGDHEEAIAHRLCVAKNEAHRAAVADGALAFLKRAADGKHRIVSSDDLTLLQIAEAQANGLFYVEPGGGLGWALLPWHLRTEKDKDREDARAP